MQRPIRVIHLSTVHPSNDGRIYYKECASLAQQYEVHLIANGSASGVKGVVVHALPKTGLLGRFIVKPLKAFAIIRKIQPKVVHFHDPELMLFGVFLKLFRYKVVYDVHEDLPKQILYKPYLKFNFTKQFLSKTIALLEQICVRFFDAIVVVTSDIQAKYPAHKTHLVRNFPITKAIVSTHRKHFQVPLKLVYAGGLTKVRGIYELLEAITQLSFPVELNLYGQFNDVAYEQQCKSSLGWTQVQFHGLVPMREVYQELHQYDIGLGLLHPIKNYLTSLPVKAFEYMAAGIPMLFSDFKYWKTVFGEYSYFANAQQPKEIAKAIEYMVNNEQDAFEKTRSARNKIRHEWSWEAEQLNLFNVYEKLK